jgi:hypothetical protein
MNITSHKVNSKINKLRFDWSCKLYNGGEVLDINKNKLKYYTDLQIGNKYIIPTMFGWSIKTIIEINGYHATAEGKENISDLTWADDDRMTWTSYFTFNKNCEIKIINELIHEH